jgi:nitrogen regulatory protein P-II 2
MKMVVAYVEPDRFDEIREDLLELGFVSISVLDASGSTPEPTVTGSYRGAKLERHLRPKARIELVVADDASATVVEAITAAGGERTFVTVSAVDEAYPEELVKSLAGTAGLT